MRNMDRIKIQNLEVFANHGVFPEENTLGQKFLISAVLETNMRKAGYSDALSDSINYGEICQFITAFMKEHTYQLIEAVAEHMAEEMLMTFPGLLGVRLEIKKPWAPIGLHLETVSIEIERKWHQAYLAIGSNMGERERYLTEAVERLMDEPKIKAVRTSDWIETEPYGYTDQDAFLNGAIAIWTLFTPYELLDKLHEIEQQAGRERNIHWGPRTLDLDILFYEDEILEEPDLIIPHPDMQNRMFVLEPLTQLCPGKIHPVLHKTVQQMKKELS
jgi:dihydroneopterin aldolase/2-amino-4-hydroxy-6-hydroxymethyldihydropteridine diphosphokinase